MEPFRLPFPSLQFLASHAVVRCLVSMKVDNDYWLIHREDSLRECLQRVDKLTLTPATREYVKNVLKRFFEQVKEWILHNDDNLGADILVDARGNIDEKRMSRHHFEKRYEDEIFREDFRKIVPFLEHLLWYYPDYSRDFVSIIVNLQKTNTSLEGPEYRLVDGDMQVVFQFVNCRCVPPEFNALVLWDKRLLTMSIEQNDIHLTYCVDENFYDEDMFRIHLNLLQLSQRLEFVKDVLYEKIGMEWLPHQMFHLFNVLDPEMRQNCLLCLDEEDFHDTACAFLKFCLVPGYESLFIPMMKLVGLNLDSENYFYLFVALVRKIDLIGFDSMLSQFWQLVPASAKSEFQDVLKLLNDDWHVMKEAMKTLSQANRALFQVVFNDVTVGLPKEQARLLLRVILNE